MNERDPYEILQLSPSAVPEVVEAAYRALAFLHHPDRSDHPDGDRAMADLNWAYRTLRDPELRAAYNGARAPIPVTAPPQGASPQGASLMERVRVAAAAAVERDPENPANVTLDFGRYAGMSLGQIVRLEPAYLEWLRRHSSGLRYRHQIDAVLTKLAARRVEAVSSVE
jgi:curved DNA-binding protein CbpA